MQKKKVIDFESLNTFPDELLHELKAHEAIFRGYEFLEELTEDNKQIRTTVSKLNYYCMDNLVVGYHYTRGFRDDFLKHGLLSQDGGNIRDAFLEKYTDLFSKDELVELKAIWDRSFDKNMKKTRDRRIFFNLTLTAFPNNGAENLLRFYGGEQVYFYLMQDETISSKLKEIGKPMIIRAILNPRDLEAYGQLGKIAVSSYHKSVNPNAHRCDTDAHTTESIGPDLIEIIDVSEFDGTFRL